MTEELLKDLCARLPFGVIVHYEAGGWSTDTELNTGMLQNILYNVDCTCKPYLRSMDSLTDEEDAELDYLFYRIAIEDYLDYIYRNHIDWKNLISKGLAIEVTKDNNPYEK